MSYISIHITTPTRLEGDKIARTLVEEKLAACVNIISEVRSVFRWQGVLKTTHECYLMVKTRAELFEQVEKRVKALHTDSCPCIVAVPIEKGHQPYLDWLKQETKV